MVEKLLSILMILALVFPMSAVSVELGNVEVYSRFGEPLLAYIPIDATDIRNRANIDVGVELPEKSTLFNPHIAQSFFLEQLRLKPVLDDHGIGRIEITTSKAARDVYLEFVLKLAWHTGQLRHKYAIVLDLPSPHEKTDRNSAMAPSANRAPAAIVPSYPVKKTPLAPMQPVPTHNTQKIPNDRDRRDSAPPIGPDSKSNDKPRHVLLQTATDPQTSADETGDRGASYPIAKPTTKGTTAYVIDQEKPVKTQVRSTPPPPIPISPRDYRPSPSTLESTLNVNRDTHEVGSEVASQDKSVWWLALGSALLGVVLVLAVITAVVRWSAATPQKRAK